MFSWHGLFSWTPIILFAIIGLYFFYKNYDKEIALYMLLGFILQLYLLSTWYMWWGGAAFGQRKFLNCSLIFIVGLAALIQWLRDKNISINYYTTFVLRLLIGAGLIFQMPILSFILTKMGLVTPKFLRKSWRYAIIIILFFAAFITPPDPISMFMMGIPLLFLYEFSIVISKVALKSSNETSEEESLAG